MLDNPQAIKEIPVAYRTSSIEYAAGFVDGKRAKQKQVVDMLNDLVASWVRPSGINFRAELNKIIERVENLDEPR